MKSIQIILLLCIWDGHEFPGSFGICEHVEANLAVLMKKGLIVKDDSDMVTGYDVTAEGKQAIYQLCDVFTHEIKAL